MIHPDLSRLEHTRIFHEEIRGLLRITSLGLKPAINITLCYDINQVK